MATKDQLKTYKDELENSVKDPERSNADLAKIGNKVQTLFERVEKPKKNCANWDFSSIKDSQMIRFSGHQI